MELSGIEGEGEDSAVEPDGIGDAQHRGHFLGADGPASTS